MTTLPIRAAIAPNGPPVTFESAAITSGTGSVSSVVPILTLREGAITNSGVAINLTGVANSQRLTVALFGTDDGTNRGDVGIRMGLVLGDATGDGVVNSSDITQAKAQSGQAVTPSTFRYDVIANGSINATDISRIKAQSGGSLPPSPLDPLAPR